MGGFCLAGADQEPASQASGAFRPASSSAVTREAREETGLDVVVGDLVGLFSSDGETVVLAVYEATAAVGEPCAGDDLTEVGWFATSELPELAFPRDRRILEAWLSARPSESA